MKIPRRDAGGIKMTTRGASLPTPGGKTEVHEYRFFARKIGGAQRWSRVGSSAVMLKVQPLLSQAVLLWERIKASHIAMSGGAIVLVLLTAFAVFYFLASGSPRPARSVAHGPAESFTPDSVLPQKPVLILTEIGSKERRGRRGRTNVSVKIGVAPRAHDMKGAVEIRVFFFDENETGELRPTAAKVDYKWLTSVRDWTDPTPKFLIATYQGLPRSRRSPEKLRYGGYVVRVYFDGQLQDERSEPEKIVAALRRGGAEPAISASIPAPAAAEVLPAASPPEVAEVVRPALAPATPALEKESLAEAAVSPVPNVPTADPTPAGAGASTAPYASPVPGKPGFVYSPYNEKFLIDVRGFAPGTELKDPNTGKPLRVP